MSIVKKIEQRNKLDKEIDDWFSENVDMDGMNSKYADITDHITGKSQGDFEWCEQHQGHCEDEYYGHYYWGTNRKDKFVHMTFYTQGREQNERNKTCMYQQ